MHQYMVGQYDYNLWHCSSQNQHVQNIYLRTLQPISLSSQSISRETAIIYYFPTLLYQIKHAFAHESRARPDGGRVSWGEVGLSQSLAQILAKPPAILCLAL